MKTINIFKYFPIKSDNMLSNFLKKDDEYDERTKQLYSILIIPDTKKKLIKSVLNAVFSPHYVATHRWPTNK